MRITWEYKRSCLQKAAKMAALPGVMFTMVKWYSDIFCPLMQTMTINSMTQ